MPCSSAHSPIARVCSGEYTAPVGFDGDTNSSTLVRVGARGLELLDRDEVALVGAREHVDLARRRRA